MYNKIASAIIKGIRKALHEGILNQNHSVFRELKHFHPSGQPMPENISNLHKCSGYLSECHKNMASFTLNEGVHPEQYGLKDYRGGIIVFSTDVNAVKLSDNAFINKIRQYVETFKNRWNKGSIVHSAINDFNTNSAEYIGAYSIGNSFHGCYVGDNGEKYDEKSLTVEINGLSSDALLELAELICKHFKQETVLVKDLNKNKMYYADAIKSDDSDAKIDQLNSKC